jgi:ferric-dicitrate binding protein FerR (iron transport regulator)
MSSNPQRLDILFKKYIAGSCTAEELQEFWMLMSQLTDEEQLSIGLSRNWEEIDLDQPHNNVKWSEVYERLHQRIRKVNEVSKTLRKNRYYYSAAAVLIGVILMSFYLSLRNKDSLVVSNQEVADARTHILKDVVHVVTLPDGTTVTLRGDSQLQYDSLQFVSALNRSIKVTGEAYFDVAHDARRPFIVSTGTYDIKVLGTAFNINTNSKKLEVTVTRGKVKIEKKNDQEVIGILIAGMQLAVDSDTSPLNKRLPVKVNADSVIQWVKQDLIFKNDTWQTASETIKSRFGVDVKMVNASLMNCKFTADFTNKSLDEFMDILCMLTNAKWEKKGATTIELSGEGCPD